ncbi:subtilisin-like serine protease [Didymella heteroderae]|uniref:Subtilisin-like serine protease n=1 Tax=Didymella heteroderae TaxID=1769908 RepID=A0A9P4WIF7_9PLEO|nr:subtilisin-like serine protease [Didymella heteroderae]
MQLILFCGMTAIAGVLSAPVTILEPAPLLEPRQGTTIPGKYIVKMKDASGQDTINLALKLLNKPADQVYRIGVFQGFAAALSDSDVQKLRQMPTVQHIEKDARFKADWAGDHVEVLQKRTLTGQSAPSWGLGRISNLNSANFAYTYDDSAGAGTCSYVIDTGIYTAHPDFGGRATFLANFAGDGSNNDGHGHGTHVAGTLGSKTYGVAKKTKLYAVKVLSNTGVGTTSGVIAGINFAVNDSRSRACPKGAVANLSLAGSKSASLDTAVARAVATGLMVVAGAGNAAADASNTSPASEASAFTVGATDIYDRFASFSNFGPVVDILAPGVSILSTSNTGGTEFRSGTSMATPHVAGLAAYLLGLEGTMAPSALAARIQALAQKGRIAGVPSGTTNLLINNGIK